jgi:hypothetical protein
VIALNGPAGVIGDKEALVIDDIIESPERPDNSSFTPLSFIPTCLIPLYL